MLIVHGITKSYGRRGVIGSASFRLPAGEILCLTGPSGIGKTTLLEIIAGIIPPDAGTVHVNGGISLLFQDNVLIPWLNAAANIQYILPPDLPHAEAETRARKWLCRFGLEEAQFPAAMSGGMLRRLALARTFAATRPLLLLDEPFAFLDDDWQRVVAEEMAAHAAGGGSILVTSHMIAPLSRKCFDLVPHGIMQLSASPIHLDDRRPSSVPC